MSPRNLAELGVVIRRARKECGFTQEVLAAAAGVSDTTILRLERGEFGRPDPEKLQRIARALSIDAEDLFALAHYTPSDGLPGFGPYLRAKFGDELPAKDRRDLEAYFQRLRAKRHGSERGRTR